ncbi:MAG TPA: TSUP family transporter, partial [Kofleriaceae bacterium]|nr:TSUP family transporter [Kofleriaceae bacterium]
MDFTLTVEGVEIGLVGLIALGSGVGLVAGMFGVGGGFLLVPLLGALLGVPLPAAVAAGLCQTIATGLGALLRYRSMGHAETRFDLLLIGGSLLGVDAGTRLLVALDGAGAVSILGQRIDALRLCVTALYVLLFLVMAGILWWKPSPAAAQPVRPGPLARVPLPPRVHLPVAG